MVENLVVRKVAWTVEQMAGSLVAWSAVLKVDPRVGLLEHLWVVLTVGQMVVR